MIINPQTGNRAGVWMTSCPEEMVMRIWGFWKDELKLDHWGEGCILTVERCSWVFRISTDRDLWHHKMRCALGWSQNSMVSIVSLAKTFKNCVSLLVIVYVLYYSWNWDVCGFYTRRVWNQRTNRVYPNYNITEIVLNSEESPRDLKRLVVIRLQWMTID